MKMFSVFLISLCLNLFSSNTYATTINELSWLAGEWRGTSRAGTYETIFMVPSGGIILGLSRLVDSKDTTTFFEYFKISQVKESLVLNPMPFAKEGVAFTLKEQSWGNAIFENKEHEYPNTITYQILVHNVLLVTVLSKDLKTKNTFKLSKQ